MSYHFGLVGSGGGTRIAAYGSLVAIGADTTKAWTCAACTFHNAETLGRFCSSCGNPRKREENYCGSPRRREEKKAIPDLRAETPRLVRDVVEDTPPQPWLVRDVVEDTPPQPYGTKIAPPSQEQMDEFSLTFSPEEAGKKRTVTLRPAPEEGGEGSFTVGNLFGPPPLDTDSKLTQNHTAKPATLEAKDFQMSFANWSISDQGAWTCVACTYVNTNVLHLTCEVCGQNRPTKTAGDQAQKEMQSMFENSMRGGQHDFLKTQQEKIEEIEERVMAAERMEEIIELQEGLMEEFQAPQNSSAPDREENIQLAGQWITELEDVRAQEGEEHKRMDHYLEGKRQTLGLKRMNAQRFNLSPTTRPLPGLESTPEALEVRGQERMLSQWKQQYDGRSDDVKRIRKRQEAIYEKLQNIGNF
jgi:hypothetical protein